MKRLQGILRMIVVWLILGHWFGDLEKAENIWRIRWSPSDGGCSWEPVVKEDWEMLVSSLFGNTHCAFPFTGTYNGISGKSLITSPLSFLDQAGRALKLRDPSFRFMGPSALGASTMVSGPDGLPTLSFGLLNRFHIFPS